MVSHTMGCLWGRRSCYNYAVIGLLILAICGSGFESKILVVVTGGPGSHFISDLQIAKMLLARGHEVWVTIDETSHTKRFPGSGVPPEVKVVLYYAPLTEHSATLVRRYVSNQLRGSNANSVLQYRIEAEDREIQASLEGRKADIFSSLSYYIDDVLSSKEVVEQLRSLKFDVIVGDAVQPIRVFLSQALKVPFVLIGLTPIAPSQHDHFAHNPSSPAYVPERLSLKEYI